MSNPSGLEGVFGGLSAQNAVIRERSLALEAVLRNAPTLGVQEAVEKFGASLTPTERQLVSSLSQDELTAFVSTRDKLGGIAGLRALDDNNNNNL